MQFTAQEEYSLRCLLRIAQARFMTVPEIAEKEGISKAYAAKLVRLLREAGFVRSTRGQKGGYELAQEPEEVSVASVMQAIGGRLYSGGFCDRFSGDRDGCVRDVDCATVVLILGCWCF